MLLPDAVSRRETRGARAGGGGDMHPRAVAAGEVRLVAWVPAPLAAAGRGQPRFLLPQRMPRLRPVEYPEPREGVVFTRLPAASEARVRFPRGTTFHATGSVAGPLVRNGHRVKLSNHDAFCYGAATPALYQSHPWVLAVRPDGSAVGLLADTFRRGEIATGQREVVFRFEAEPFSVLCLEAADPAAVVRGLATLVGTMPMPPRWALGYHQCRFSYSTAEEVRTIARELRARRIPCDAIWLDIDYMDRFRVFTWNRASFPEPARLARELRREGLRVVALVDPGLAASPDYEPFMAARRGGHLVRAAAKVAGGARAVPHTAATRLTDGLAIGAVWPGACAFPDFTAQRTQRWWADRVARFVAESGLDGLLCDMNEPAVFDGPDKTLPDSARHRGWPGAGSGDHARFHNLYGQLMAEATRAGLEAAYPARRPFLVSRSLHLRGGAVAGTWTGDNQSDFTHLAWSIPMALNLGLSGQPFAGPDVGGFYGAPSRELFVRWYELAAFLPFFRGHADKTSPRQEPWAFGKRAEGLVKRAIERRMRLLPTLYTLFREAHESGLPVVRPVFFLDPRDAALRAVDDAFLLGDALLVAPVVVEGARRKHVILPGVPGGWFRLGARGRRIERREIEVAAPLGEVPLFARAGTIIFEDERRVSAASAGSGALILHVFLDREGRAAGRLFDDGGDGRESRRDPRRSDLAIEIEMEAARGQGEIRSTGRRSREIDRRPVELRIYGVAGGVGVRCLRGVPASRGFRLQAGGTRRPNGTERTDGAERAGGTSRAE